jgi:hypothetical protein
MHEIMNRKFYLGPKFGTLFNKKWITISELLQRTLEVGDLVLRRILSREGLHKLSPMWEGPFKVMHIARPGSVRLETAEGVPVGNPWNIAHLRKFYP